MSSRTVVGAILWGGIFWLSMAAPSTAATADGEFRPVAVGDSSGERTCLTAPLVAGSTVTALDVLRDLFPDLSEEGTGQTFAGAESAETASDPDAAAEAEREVDIGSTDWTEMAVIEAGKVAYAAAVSDGVIALAAIRPAYKPLGRLNVATDPGGPATGYRLMMAAPDRPLVVSVSSHFNSQEGFDSFLVAGLIHGRLADLYDGPYLYSVKLGSDSCDTLEHAETASVFEPARQTHQGLADLRVVITYTRSCVTGDARQVEASKTFPMTLVFDGKRYRGGSKGLDRLNNGLAE